MAWGPGLGRKQLVFEDKGRELFPGHSIVQPGSTRVPSGIQGYLFMEDEASGHRAEGPSLETYPEAPGHAFHVFIGLCNFHGDVTFSCAQASLCGEVNT